MAFKKKEYHYDTVYIQSDIFEFNLLLEKHQRHIRTIDFKTEDLSKQEEHIFIYKGNLSSSEKKRGKTSYIGITTQEEPYINSYIKLQGIDGEKTKIKIWKEEKIKSTINIYYEEVISRTNRNIIRVLINMKHKKGIIQEISGIVEEINANDVILNAEELKLIKEVDLNFFPKYDNFPVTLIE